MRFAWRNEKYYERNGGQRYGYHAAEVWERDGKACTECGSKTRKHLVIHHIINYNPNDERTIMIENLVVICRKCHSRMHRKTNSQLKYCFPKIETLKRIHFNKVIDEFIETAGE